MIRPYEQHEVAIVELQKQNPTEEICGVLLPRQGKFEVVQIKNDAVNKTQTFSMDMAKYADESPICWHTHPSQGDTDGPSDPDKYSSAAMRLPICIYVQRTGKFHYWQPGDYHASILGRPWCPGIFDCFALIRDAIYEFWDVRLPDLDRTFVHASHGIPNIDKFFEPAGCELVHRADTGRVAVINHGGAKYPNHVALFIDKTSVLHQMRGQPSRIDFYSENLRHSTLYFMRHPKIEETIATTNWQYGVKHEHRVAGAFAPQPNALIHQPLKAASATRQKALRGLPRR